MITIEHYSRQYKTYGTCQSDRTSEEGLKLAMEMRRSNPAWTFRILDDNSQVLFCTGGAPETCILCARRLD
jgi:hypothetical protein